MDMADIVIIIQTAVNAAQSGHFEEISDSGDSIKNRGWTGEGLNGLQRRIKKCQFLRIKDEHKDIVFYEMIDKSPGVYALNVGQEQNFHFVSPFN